MATPNAVLRQLRVQQGLTIQQLAKAAGVSTPTVSRIETGTRGASLRTLHALADALGVEPELIGGLSLDRAS